MYVIYTNTVLLPSEKRLLFYAYGIVSVSEMHVFCSPEASILFSRAGLMTSNHHRGDVQRGTRRKENRSGGPGGYWATSMAGGWGPRGRSECSSLQFASFLSVPSDIGLGSLVSASFLPITSFFFAVWLGVLSPALPLQGDIKVVSDVLQWMFQTRLQNPLNVSLTGMCQTT